VDERREEIAEGVWVFRSAGFAGQLSTLVSLGEEALLVDPPMFREEADEIRAFARGRGLKISWLVLTHAHGDHAYGMAHFPEALVIAHREFWPFWERTAPIEAEYFARVLPGYRPPPLRAPNITFSQDLSPTLGARRLLFRHAPGHSPDGLVVELPDEGIWIAGDTVIPIPYLASGDREELLTTLRRLLSRWAGETIVMGHDRVLRGEEAQAAIECNVRYLEQLEEAVRSALAEGKNRGEVLRIPLSAFGIPEDALSGLAKELHRVNLDQTYKEFVRDRV
jgi:glyoxylase-like metal-dependent hydrolase (beta-lactamase superfamily II)